MTGLEVRREIESTRTETLLIVTHFLSLETQAICDDPLVMQVEKIRWLDKNVLVAASRVLKHMTADWQQSRAENMLHLCSDLIDLDITNLAIKILKNVSHRITSAIYVVSFSRLSVDRFYTDSVTGVHAV